MTSFAYAPSVMSSAHFDSYSTDSYPEFLQTSQPYPTTTAFTEPSFSALSTFDSMPVLSAYSDVSNTQEPSYFSLNRSDSVNTFGSDQSSGEHLAPPRLSSSSESGASVQSTSSSTMASPHLQPQYQVDNWNPLVSGSGLPIESNDLAPPHDIYFSPPSVDGGSKMSGYVDPTAINFSSSLPYSAFSDVGLVATSAADYFEPRGPSPVQSQSGKAKSPRMSPYQVQPYHPYSYPAGRRQSTSSSLSRHSSQLSDSFDVNEVDRERGVCPWPECGRSFKDLKAHMLTHQTERPEKCPIQSCEYHTKGFARKYDKNRHTLTHYKGTMVCGFCPGSGSSVEKSFNRADVFKRHLTSVHGVEQVPPNSRRKSPISGKKNASSTPGQTGTCSTCSVTFSSAQEFYEHLDDCVLRVVQQIDPAEAINQKHLGTIAEDKEVKETLDKHNLPTSTDYTTAESFDEDEDEDADEDDIDGDDANDASYGSRNARSGKGSIKPNNKASGGSGTTWQSSSRVTKPSRSRPGLTLSKGGVRLNSTTLSGRKKRKNYPTSWGSNGDKMKMKKRVLCVYDGQRRLCKDDMMLDSEFEVRLPLPQTGGSDDDEAAPFGRPAYVTDLDVQTLRRADAIFAATEDERGPWIPDNILEADSIEDLLA